MKEFEEFEEIDLEWVEWMLDKIESKPLVQKLRKLKGNYPTKPNLFGISLKNFKFLNFLKN